MAVRLRYDEVDTGEVEADPEKAVRSPWRPPRPERHGRRVQHLHRDVGAARGAAADRTARHDGLTLVHLYPREMNIYGDTGNVVVLKRRLEWRGAAVRVVPVSVGDPLPHDADILLGGGGQDAAQGEIGADFAARGAELRAMADDGVVMLDDLRHVPDARSRVHHPGRRHIQGVGVLDVVTRGQRRAADRQQLRRHPRGRPARGLREPQRDDRTRPGVRPLGTTQAGRGNNGLDRTEGAVRDNVIGTYLHGPVLAKSPRFADDLLRRALRRRGIDDDLEPLDDGLADRAAGGGRPAPLTVLGVGVRIAAAARSRCRPSARRVRVVGAAFLRRGQRRGDHAPASASPPRTATCAAAGAACGRPSPAAATLR